MCATSSLPGRRAFTAEKFENRRWVNSTTPATPGGLICKDFLPLTDPDLSTCCSTVYQSFSETVQQANEWLNRHEGAEVVNCEVLPFTPAGQQSFLPDAWPVTTHLRGLRVWARTPEDGASVTGCGRCLLSYRDFSPYLDRKNLFSRDYEDTGVLLDRLNDYLANRTSPARILSIQTVDSPMSGVLELDVDTEKSRLTHSLHGYTKYCRSLRVFFVTQYQRNPRAVPSSLPAHRTTAVGLKDFLPKTKLDAFPRDEETLSEVLRRALTWCQTTAHATLLNLQVLSVKVGRPTTASTWVLECPGHIANKFTNFVRVAFSEGAGDRRIGSPGLPTISQRDEESIQTEDSAPSLAPSEGPSESTEEDAKGSNSKKTLPPLKNKNQEKLENLMSQESGSQGSRASLKEGTNLPGVINVSEALGSSAKTVAGLQCKTVVPRLVTAGGMCGRGEWEGVEQTVSRLNSWIYTSKGGLLTIHTHHVYTKGRKDEVDVESAGWARHLAGAGQVGVLHVVVEGGRCPTAFPTTPPTPARTCAIL